MAESKYTRAELERALERAKLNPTENANHIVNITNMINNGQFRTESWEREDGAYVFDRLNENEDYNKSLQQFYGRYKKNPEVDKPLGQRKKGFSNIAEDFGQMSTLSNWQDLKYDDSGNLAMSNEELKEKSFELFNTAMWNEVNLFRLGNEISKMSEGERDNLAKLYDIYERTAIMGEGNRPWHEKFKDVAHMAYAPSSWVGLRWIGAPLAKPVFQAAMKKMLKGGLAVLTFAEKEVLKKGTASYANRFGLIGAGVAGGYDAAHQKQLEMRLDPEQEYDPGRTAMATGLGYGLGFLMSKAPKYAGKIVRAPGAVINQVAPNLGTTVRHPLQAVGGAFMRSFGGKKAAKFHITAEGEEAFGLAARDVDVTGQGLRVKDEVNEASTKAFSIFKEDFRNLGDLDIQIGKIKDPRIAMIQLIDTITGKKGLPGWVGLAKIRDRLIAGDLSPTEALRKVRSKIGQTREAAKIKTNAWTDYQDHLKYIDEAVRKLMRDSAKRAGKLDEFTKLDKRYSNFLRVRNKNEVSNLMTEDSSKTIAKLRTFVASDNYAKLNEHFNRMEEMAYHAGGPEYRAVVDKIKKGFDISKLTEGEQAILKTGTAMLETNKHALRAILGEKMFKGTKGAGLLEYLGHRQGRDVLKKLWPEHKEFVDHLSRINQVAEDKGDMGMFAMRLFTATFAGVIGGGLALTGQIGSAMATGAGYIAMEGLIRTKWFRKAAAKSFSRDPKKSMAERLKLANLLEKKGYSARQTNKIMNLLVGSAVWSYALTNENHRQTIKEAPGRARNSWLGKLLIDNNLTKASLGAITEYGGKALGYGGKVIDEKIFQPVFNTVTDQLISEQQE